MRYGTPKYRRSGPYGTKRYHATDFWVSGVMDQPDTAMSSEEERRQRILDAAFECFFRHGYAGTSTLAIARLARVSKRDIYTLFGNKQGLLRHCISGRAALMRPPDLPPPENLAALIAMVQALGASFLREITRPGTLAMYRLAITESDRSLELAEELDQSGRATVQEATRAMFAAAVSRGLLAGDPGAITRIFLATLVEPGLMLRLLMRVAEAPDEARIAADAARATALVLRAFAA